MSFSQTNTDFLFVGFNADGDDDFSIVLMNDLKPYTEVYFTDNQPNASGDGNSGSEGVLLWNTEGVVLPKGTVVVFTDVDNGNNEDFGSSLGGLSVVNAGFNISASGDVVYATYGNPDNNTVAVWITAIQNSNVGVETNFNVTGLSVDSNYLVIDDTSSKDGGQYSGVRNGKSITEFKSLILDEKNWQTNTSDGESILPFSLDMFSFESLSSLSIDGNNNISISIDNGVIKTSKGAVLYVYNILGQKLSNKHLERGVYFLVIEVNHQMFAQKIIL